MTGRAALPCCDAPVGEKSLGLVEKLLPLWIALAMAAGLLLGRLAPGAGAALEPAIPLGLFLMIYPAMAKLHMEDVRAAVRSGKASLLVIFFNYAVDPFLLWLFGWLFLRNQPDMWVGLILLGVAPCIAMVLVWTDLARGNNALAITLMAWNSLIQMVTTPLFIYLIIGTRIALDIRQIAMSVVLYLGLPLLLGVLSRSWLVARRGAAWYEERFTPVLGRLQLLALLATLVILFSQKGAVILEHPELIYLMVPPLALFFVTLFLVAFGAARLARLPYADAVAVGFNSTGRNFELSIAIALSAFASRPLVGVSTVIGPLIEVPVMLALVALAKRLAGQNPIPGGRPDEGR